MCSYWRIFPLRSTSMNDVIIVRDKSTVIYPRQQSVCRLNHHLIVTVAIHVFLFNYDCVAWVLRVNRVFMGKNVPNMLKLVNLPSPTNNCN